MVERQGESFEDRALRDIRARVDAACGSAMGIRTAPESVEDYAAKSTWSCNPLVSFLNTLHDDTMVSFNGTQDASPNVISVPDYLSLGLLLDTVGERRIASGTITSEEWSGKRDKILDRLSKEAEPMYTEVDLRVRFIVTCHKDIDTGEEFFDTAVHYVGKGRAGAFKKALSSEGQTDQSDQTEVLPDVGPLDTRPGYNPSRTVAENDDKEAHIDAMIGFAVSHASPIDVDETHNVLIRRLNAFERSTPREEDISDDTVITTHFTVGEHIVYADDPDDYPLLLRKAYTIFGYDKEFVDKEVAAMAMHEREHYDRAAQEPDLTPALGIEFYRTTADGGFTMQPLNSFSGAASVSAFREITSAPTALSRGDVVALGFNKGEVDRLHGEALEENEQRSIASGLDAEPDHQDTCYAKSVLDNPETGIHLSEAEIKSRYFGTASSSGQSSLTENEVFSRYGIEDIVTPESNSTLPYHGYQMED